MVSEIIFSVIIPTYNREAFLLDAVRSAVNASPEHTEIIVVNDGTNFSERTKSVLGTSNVSIVKTDGGVGAGGARNHGANHATGQWLLFLDDDDLIAAGYWKSLANFFTIFHRLIPSNSFHRQVRTFKFRRVLGHNKLVTFLSYFIDVNVVDV